MRRVCTVHPLRVRMRMCTKCFDEFVFPGVFFLVCCFLGMDKFEELLAGGHAMVSDAATVSFVLSIVVSLRNHCYSAIKITVQR